jgi:hypothetical protein
VQIPRRLFSLLEHSIKDGSFMQVEGANPKARNRSRVELFLELIQELDLLFL